MVWHVVPVNDRLPHIEEDTQCPCKPILLHFDGEMVVVHNAWDCREAVEMAEEILNGLAEGS